MNLYNFFVKNFGEKEVLAAAAKALAAPKNSVGGLAQRAEVLIGTYQSQPSPNPYMLFLTQLTNATPHNYALALCLDQYGLMGEQVVNTLSSKEQWDKAAATYGQLLARFGEPAIVAAAGRDQGPAEGRRRGDSRRYPGEGRDLLAHDTAARSKNAASGFGAVSGEFDDPRWNGKTVDVRGTVSRVEIDKGSSRPTRRFISKRRRTITSRPIRRTLKFWTRFSPAASRRWWAASLKFMATSPLEKRGGHSVPDSE